MDYNEHFPNTTWSPHILLTHLSWDIFSRKMGKCDTEGHCARSDTLFKRLHGDPSLGDGDLPHSTVTTWDSLLWKRAVLRIPARRKTRWIAEYNGKVLFAIVSNFFCCPKHLLYFLEQKQYVHCTFSCLMRWLWPEQNQVSCLMRWLEHGTELSFKACF